MRPCDAVLDHLDAARDGALPPELAAHLAACPDCQLAVERARGLAEGGGVLRSLHAPESLKQRLKTLPRMTPECERAQELLGVALDGELDGASRAELLAHLHGCASCQAVWEAFATLHEVGAQTHPPHRLHIALLLPPSQRISIRRQRKFFDLRLATAAAYLLAAVTVMLLSNPANVARASSAQMDKAVVYTRAAVENRFSSYSQRLIESAAAARGFLRDQANEVWEKARRLVGAKPANPRREKSVVPDGNGGR